ncbi:MAG: LysR family transcriptional regulator [Pseudomonadota bacterium]
MSIRQVRFLRLILIARTIRHSFSNCKFKDLSLPFLMVMCHTSLMDSRRLRHFLAVYELGSIGNAAAKLAITQPALSKSIRLLESELETTLFERTATGVVATVYGETLAHYARSIEAEMRTAQARITEMKGGAGGEVRIGVGPSIAVNMMPMLTRRLLNQRPGIRLEVREGLVAEIIPALRRGEIDFAVGLWPQALDREFEVQILFNDKISVLAGSNHKLAGRRASCEELKDYPWALPPRTQQWRVALDEYFLSNAIEPPRPHVESNSAAYIKSLLLTGKYLSFLPHQLIRAADQKTSIIAIDADAPNLKPPVTVTQRRNAVQSPAGANVMLALNEIASQMRDAGDDR